MARKSNKTAHVLNLLAGHDAAKEADEQASTGQAASGSTSAQTASNGAAPKTAPDVTTVSRPDAVRTASGQLAGQTVSSGGGTTAGNIGQPVVPPPVSVPPQVSAVSPQNNIAMIDKTGEDPVAELIQQKLSSEFEKQMQQSRPDISTPGTEADSFGGTNPKDLPLSESEDFDPEILLPSESEDLDPETLLPSESEDLDPETLLPSESEDLDPKTLLPSESEDFDPEILLASEPEDFDPELLLPSESEDFDPEAGIVSDPAASFAPEENTASKSGSSAVPEMNAADKIADGIDTDAITDDAPATASISAPPSAAQTVQAQNSIPAAQPVSAPSGAPAAQPVSAPSSAPTAQMAPETTPVQEAAASRQPTAEPEPEEKPEPDFAAVNVMEHIVKDKIIYFMRQFDVCTCDRCKADVIALTLNGLMPKYIVTMKEAVDPLLSYYTNRLISDVTVEATKSCMIVKENPRH